ncbi:MAG: hypothetical protein AAGJ93_13940 [Bacteroidota bacterium]
MNSLRIIEYHHTFIFRFILLSVVAMASWGCTDDNEPNEVEAEMSFETFHERFLSDGGFQLDHIQFPVDGLPSNPDLSLKDFQWEKSDWQIQQKIDPQETGFSSRFEHVSDGFVIEIIMHKSGKYAMERRFAKFSENEWMLIYYAALHPVSVAG